MENDEKRVGNKGVYISFWANEEEVETLQAILDVLLETNSRATRSQAVRYAINKFDMSILPHVPKGVAPTVQDMALAATYN